MSLVLLGAGVAPAVHAQSTDTTTTPGGMSSDEEARMRFDLGRRYYDTGRFADAAREFAEAYRLSQRTELLYNLYLAYRDAGDDPHAAETLRTYVGALEPGERRTQLEARLAILEERLAASSSSSTPTSTTEGTTTEGTSSEGSVTEGTSAEGSSSTSTEGSGGATTGGGGGGGMGVVPWVVVGVGGALLVGSLITGLLALDARSTLDRMCPTADTCPPGFESTQSSGQALAITTDVLWVTGLVAAGTGVVLAVLDLTSSHPSEGASATCTDQGCMAFAWGHF